MKHKEVAPNSPIKACLKYISFLPKRFRVHLLFLSLLNLVLAILDLIGLLCLGLATLRGLNGSSKSDTLNSNWLMSYLKIFNEYSTLGLFLIAICMFLLRNVLTIWLTKVLLSQVSKHQKKLSFNLFKRYLNNKLEELKLLTHQEVLNFFTDSMNSATMGLLANSVLAFSEILLLIVFVVFILTFNFWIGLFVTLYFGFVFVLLQKKLGTKASLGLDKYTKQGMTMRSLISDILPARTEIILAGKQKPFGAIFESSKNLSSDLYSSVVLFGQYPKFVLEFAVILGGSILAALQFSTAGAESTLALLAIYVGLALRVLPILMRLQGYLINTFSSYGYAQVFLTAIFRMRDNGTLGEIFEEQKSESEVTGPHGEQFEVLKCERIGFQYPQRSWTLEVPEFSIRRGEIVAIKGPSGAGKSTFTGILLGNLDAKTGLLEVNGLPMLSWIDRFPGSIAYVPQSPTLIAGTIAQNIALGIPPENINFELLNVCLEKTMLLDLVSQLEEGVDTSIKLVTETLSGGQKQRISIARALYTNPSLIIFDEPTSSLDIETENAIMKSIQQLKGSCSIIIISHNQNVMEIADAIYEMQMNHGFSKLEKIPH